MHISIENVYLNLLCKFLEFSQEFPAQWWAYIAWSSCYDGGKHSWPHHGWRVSPFNYMSCNYVWLKSKPLNEMAVHWTLFFFILTTVGHWAYPTAELYTLTSLIVQMQKAWGPRERDDSPSRKETRIRKQKEQFLLVQLEAQMSSRGVPSRVIIQMSPRSLPPWTGAFRTTYLELWKLMNLKTVTTVIAQAVWHNWRPSGGQIQPFWNEMRAVIPSLCTMLTLVWIYPWLLR